MKMVSFEVFDAMDTIFNSVINEQAFSKKIKINEIIKILIMKKFS